MFVLEITDVCVMSSTTKQKLELRIIIIIFRLIINLFSFLIFHQTQDFYYFHFYERSKNEKELNTLLTI